MIDLSSISGTAIRKGTTSSTAGNATKILVHRATRRVSLFFETDDGRLTFDRLDDEDAVVDGNTGRVASDRWQEFFNTGDQFAIASTGSSTVFYVMQEFEQR